MSQDRKMQWLFDRRIVFRRNPINDKPTISTDQYDYYEDGTYECYALFNSKAKITTYRSLKWHFLVLYYLNEDNPTFVANYAFKHIADKENGFVTFFIKEKLLDHMIQNVIVQGGDPPKNKIRKVVFKDNSGLTLNEKMSIVGRLIGRTSRVWPEDIYQCMIDLNEWGKKITWGRVAGLLDCSVRTIYRNLDDQLKQEKQILNEEI
jgi:hypothetical protein